VNQPLLTFDLEVRKFLEFVRDSYKKNKNFDVKVIWKGVLSSGLHESKHKELLALDQLAAKIMREFNVPYVNTTALLNFIPRYRDVLPSGERPYQIYTQDRIHHGGIARGHDMKKVGTVSMLSTQALLHTICNGQPLPAITGGPKWIGYNDMQPSGMMQMGDGVAGGTYLRGNGQQQYSQSGSQGNYQSTNYQPNYYQNNYHANYQQQGGYN